MNRDQYAGIPTQCSQHEANHACGIPLCVVERISVFTTSLGGKLTLQVSGCSSAVMPGISEEASIRNIMFSPRCRAKPKCSICLLYK